MHRALPVARRDKAVHTMVIRTPRGVGRALRLRTGVCVAAAVTVLTLELLLSPIALSIAGRPVDCLAFNAWLSDLPASRATSCCSANSNFRQTRRLSGRPISIFGNAS
jgi:hypothetical protein